MKEITTNILTVVNATTSGVGSLINTSATQKAADGVTDTKSNNVATAGARFLLNCTGIAGTSMAMDIVAVIGGVDITLVSFAAITSISQQSIFVENCPINVKAVYTETLITDFDATIDCIRY